MIRFLGKKKVSKRIFWALGIIIIPSFMIWGVGMEVSGSRKNTALRINRTRISVDQYNKLLAAALQQYSNYYGGYPAQDSPQMKSIKDQVVEQSIQETLIDQEAARRRLRVSDREVLAMVRSNPSFKDEKGNFNEQLFRDAVNRISDEEMIRIEKEIRRSILISKLQSSVVNEEALKVTPEELASFRARNPGVQLPDEQLQNVLIQQKSAEAFESWYKGVRARARINRQI
ncbi:MAG TPA: SurA N-terminal domain-containing protein [bacterium]|uniref:Peptidyl-prolyl cis-trans isomerase D n=1 Tax=candidate division TA06 bacterium ADurb.Bin417 TaxID=1852828 RepID=A0A1V5MDW5_UNCT6|nr:MAG: Peptidyl-prolyl cis-trans isomerase D [candidate division TA06 bacterium ADurb.Bin417]HNQ35579.1 SurA N-terminal domain-containing protein [bacterium]HNS49388.1 SurA N-terminal domain-containing protein [bacterium]